MGGLMYASKQFLDTSLYHFAWHFLFLHLLAGMSFHDEKPDQVLYLLLTTVKCWYFIRFIWSELLPTKKLGVKLFPILLCPTFSKSLKGDNGCQRQSFLMLQLSPSIWHLQVTSAKAGKEVTTRPSGCNLPLSEEPRYVGGGLGRRTVEHWDSKCCLGGSSSVNRILGIWLWQWGDKKVTVRNPCQQQTTSRGQPSAGAALFFNSKADLWRVRAAWFNVSPCRWIYCHFLLSACFTQLSRGSGGVAKECFTRTREQKLLGRLYNQRFFVQTCHSLVNCTYIAFSKLICSSENYKTILFTVSTIWWLYSGPMREPCRLLWRHVRRENVRLHSAKLWPEKQ